MEILVSLGLALAFVLLALAPLGGPTRASGCPLLTSRVDAERCWSCPLALGATDSRAVGTCLAVGAKVKDLFP